ncbi:MAG: adenine/guanine phosphoribosyltransferase-like PRPP-binding protein [Glaciecola sp.]|jgi:adenine/guanine phosphoribosyltransferase-like PRPP-binding protein
MDNFLEYIFSFPIITFTIPLMIMIVFWIFALFGTIDIAILDPDLETESTDAAGSSFLESLGLDGVPLTVAVTLIEIYGFVFVYLAKKFITPLFDGILTATASGFVVAIFALVLAIPFAAYTSKPLRRVFITHEAIEKSDLIGTYCIVTTQTVTETFGQARAEDGMIYSVRTTSDHQISGGSRIVLIDFNKDDDTYMVVTEAELMAMSSTQLS